jgi:phage shock protein A
VLQARLAELEQRVDDLETETREIRAIRQQVDELVQLVKDAGDRIADLDRLRDLVERLAGIVGIPLP